jgi:glycine/D-amino acid oxidase-like deaminating enzyme/nitrite reductase/ring-hydroxylating ferredoxin subunit
MAHAPTLEERAAPRAARRSPSPKLPTASKSLWVATGPEARFPRLSRNIRVDVAVVGGGITGLTAATLLKRAGLSVALLEGRRVAEGASGHTTAHLTEALDTRYTDLIARFGADKAGLAASSARTAIERIASFVEEHRLDCDFARVPGFLYAEDPEDVQQLEEELRAACELGLRASLVHDVPLPFRVSAALRFEDQARFHVRRYLVPLAQALPGDGSHVFENTHVLEIEDGEPCRLSTETARVSARSVIEATHVPLNRVLVQTKLAHYRSYALALRLRAGASVPSGLFWDTSDPYHYLRDQRTDSGPLLVVGGEDHKTGQDDETLGRFERLLEYARARFKVRSVAYRWSAQVAEPVDGLPFIGRNPLSSHLYVATGYSGTGLTFGTLAGMLLSDLILGRANPWQQLYDPGRLTAAPAVAAGFVKENVDYPVRMIADRLKAAEAESFSEVARGRGKLVKADGKTLAVYRDEHGAAHAVSAVCTHLGCQVVFNEAERTWDCPCHGSRFDINGEVVNGPAVEPLKRWPGR